MQPSFKQSRVSMREELGKILFSYMPLTDLCEPFLQSSWS